MATIPRPACIALASLVAAGCGDDRGLETQGTVRGSPVTFVEAVAEQLLEGENGDYLVIVASSSEGACERAVRQRSARSGQVLVLFVFDYDQPARRTVLPSAPGKFPVLHPFSGRPSAPGAAAEYRAMNDACELGPYAAAYSGTVTLTAVDGAEVSGTAELMLDTGDKLTVEFSRTLPCWTGGELRGAGIFPAC